MSENILPENWVWTRLGDLCLPIEDADFRKRATSSFQYIDISSIDREQKSIISTEQMDNMNAPSRAQQIVAKKDVLVSTVRPGLNAVAVVPEHLDSEICSTGFCVLRANPGVLDFEYLFAWTRSSKFVQDLTRMERGIGYPAVSNNDVENILIPLPPLLEQHRIATILREADEIRKLRRRASEKMQEIVSALFYEMFGDPIRRQSKWVKKSLGEFANITSSLVNPTKKEYQELPLIGSDNIDSATGSLLSLRSVHDIGAISGKFLFTDQHILYSKIRPALRKVATPDFNGLCSADIYPLEYDREQVSKLFLAQLLRSNDFTSYTMRVSGRAQIPKINREDLLKYETILPDLDRQKEFERRAKEAISTQSEFDIFTSKLDTVHQSLLDRAFTGELTALWRDQHAEELAQEARERDHFLTQLRLAPAKLTTPTQLIRSEISERQELLELLNDVQSALLVMIDENPTIYYTASDAQEALAIEYTLDIARRELHFLAATGWIKEQTLPAEAEAGNVHYIPVYRSLLPDDNSQRPDIEQLIARLGSEYPDEVLV